MTVVWQCLEMYEVVLATRIRRKWATGTSEEGRMVEKLMWTEEATRNFAVPHRTGNPQTANERSKA